MDENRNGVSGPVALLARLLRAARAFIGLSAVLLAGGSPAQPAESTDPQKPGGFARVAAKLDEGGSFYMIWDVGGAIRGGLRSADSLVKAAANPQAALALPLLRGLMASLGLSDLGYFGMSVSARPGGIARSTLFIQTPERKGLLSLNGEPRSLELPAHIPRQAAVAMAAALEFNRVVPILEQAAASAAGAVGTDRVKSALERAKNNGGVDIRQVLDGAGDEIAFMAMADSSETMTLALRRGRPVEMPRPRAAILVNPPSDSLFRMVAEAAKTRGLKHSLASHDGWEVLAFAAPDAQTPFAPVVGFKPGVLALADSTSTLELLAATRQSGQSVTSNSTFRFLSEGMPETMLKMLFVNPAALGSPQQWLDQMPARRPQDRAARRLVAELAKMAAGASLTVATYEDGGFLLRSHCSKATAPAD